MPEQNSTVLRTLGCGGFLLVTLALLGALVTTLVLMLGGGASPTRYHGDPATAQASARTGRGSGGSGSGKTSTAGGAPGDSSVVAAPPTSAPPTSGPAATTTTVPAGGVTPSGSARSPVVPPLAGVGFRAGEACSVADANQSVVEAGVRLVCEANGGNAQWVTAPG